MSWHDLLLVIGAGLVGIGLSIAARSLRRMRFDRETGLLAVAGRRYALHRRSGTIVAPGRAIAQRDHRTVDAHGFVVVGDRAPAPDDGSLALIDRHGASHVLRFRTWRIEVGPGDVVGAIWAIPLGQRSGGYIAYRNATRDETRVSRRLLGGMMRVRRSGLAALFAGVAVLVGALEWRWREPVALGAAVVLAALGLQRWRVHRFVRDDLPGLLAAIDRDARDGR